ncbi:hypothetical protein, partial [Erwinia amylovora]|uniref:hypothetical protein n=1 Tax=Erwinia amylovora TaxID=552 RepID=UPI003D6FC0ED
EQQIDDLSGTLQHYDARVDYATVYVSLREGQNSGVDPMIVVEAKMADVYFIMTVVPMLTKHYIVALLMMPLSVGMMM